MTKDKEQSPESLRLRRQAEERVREQTDAVSVTAAAEADELRRLNHELRVHQVELEMQNEELVRAKDAAVEALARFQDLYERAAVGYVTLDSEGTILAVNLTAATLLGEERARLVGRPFKAWVVDGESQLLGFLAHVFAGADKQYCEVTLRPSGKAERYFRMVGQAAGSGKACRVALLDITDLHQEELFHLQLECVEGYAVYLLDNRGVILNWNPGAERLKGYGAEEVIGKSFACFYSEEDRKRGRPQEELTRAATEGRFAGECWRVRKDGSGFWADVVLTPLRDETGRLWGFSKVTHDITERKKAQDDLRYSEARYRALFEDNPTMIMTLDFDWMVLSANPSAIQQLGYSKEELEGRSVMGLVCQEDRAALAEQFLRCMTHPNSVCHLQFRKIRKDGGLLWVEETVRASLGIGGAPILVVVCHDVTERKRAEEERERLLMELDAVLENINEAVVIADDAANVLRMNRAALALYGYRRGDKQIHRPLEQYQDTFEISDLDGRRVPFENWPFVRVLRGESFVDCELRVLRKDTGKSWIGSYNGSQVRGTESENTLAVIAVRDITERKRVESAFRESEARFHAIFNLAAVGIAQVGLDGKWLLMNQKLADILGYRFAELETMTLQQISHPDDVAPHLMHIDHLLAGELPSYAMEKRCLRKDGSAVWVNLNVTLVRDQRGKPQYFIAIMQDVNDRKIADQEIKRLNASLAERAAELEAVNEELEAFNYTVAHDLRQPLNVINGCCQVIDRLYGDTLEEECKEHVELAYQTTLRMDRLIEALLDFSRMGHVEPRRENVDLGMLADEVLASLQGAEPDREVEFRVAGGMVADGDPALLRVVLYNLLGNAWKFTRIRQKAVIEFGLSTVDGVPVYFVRDNGVGLDKGDAEKIFAPFQRLPGAEKQRGFGIGLATVERIIRRHGGKVWAEGAPDQGACFFFTLPEGS